MHVTFPNSTLSRRFKVPKKDITSQTIPEEEEMDTTQSSPGESEDRWLKFNDTLVEEFVFTDSLLEAECFGGTIKTSSADPCKLKVCVDISIHVYVHVPLCVQTVHFSN